MNILDGMNKILKEEGRSYMNKEELIERYGVRFLMWLYMDIGNMIELEIKEEELFKKFNDRKLVGEKLLESYGEVLFAKVMLTRFKSVFYQEMITYYYGELIFQDMMNFLIK